MAKCTVCEGEMLKVKGCSNHVYLLNDNTRVKPVRVGEPGDWLFGEEEGRCSDCNASIGETHHIGCDTERCSICKGQFITCDCNYSEKILVTTSNWKHSENNIN